MTIKHLEIFKVVYTYRSITAAAEFLNMTQPAVSIALKELETYYNTKLFTRTSRGVSPTQQGDFLFSKVEDLIDKFDEVTTVLRNDKVFTRIRLGVNVSVAETSLATTLHEIEKMDKDNINLELTINNSLALEKMLVNDQLDVVITDNISNLSVNDWIHPLEYQDDMVAVCSEDEYSKDSISVEDLSEMKLFLREEGSAARACVNQGFERHGIKVHPVVESTSTLSLIQLARDTVGFSILPRPIAEDLNADTGLFKKIKVVNISNDRFIRKYYIIYDPEKHSSDIMKNFIKEISLL